MKAASWWSSFRVVLGIAVFVLPLNLASAQEGQFLPDEKQVEEWLANIGKPGAEHDRLKLLIGEWTTVVRLWNSRDAEPTELHGESKKEMVLGDRYLRETVSTPEEGTAPFEGIGYTGYDGLTKVFQYVWMNNRTTNMHSEAGRYYPDENLFRMVGSNIDPVTGALFTTTIEIRVGSPDEHVLTSYETGPDGTAFRNLEIVFTRK